MPGWERESRGIGIASRLWAQALLWDPPHDTWFSWPLLIPVAFPPGVQLPFPEKGRPGASNPQGSLGAWGPQALPYSPLSSRVPCSGGRGVIDSCISLNSYGSLPPRPIPKDSSEPEGPGRPAQGEGIVSSSDTWACSHNYGRDHSAAENAKATTCYGSQKPDWARRWVKLPPQTVQVHRPLERTAPRCGSSSGCSQGQARTRRCRRKPSGGSDPRTFCRAGPG